MNNYMVVCTFALDTASDAVTAVLPAEQAVVKTLQEEGKLSSVRVSLQRN